MKNLFVIHTQYNLILSEAVIEESLSEDENHLIIFKDFNIDTRMIETLKKQFKTVRIYTGSLSKEDQRWRSKIVRYPKLNRIFKSDDIVYDRVFIVEDTTISEQYIMRHSYKKNKNVYFSCIGDGGYAYFNPDGVAKTGLARHGYTMLLRKLIFKYLFALGRFYTAAWCFGTSPLLETCYEMYPEYLREELQGKKKHEIKGVYLRKAVKNIYSYLPEVNINENSLIIMLDKLVVYEDIELFSKVIGEVTAKAKAEGRTVYYKYHPAEKNTYDKLAAATEIDRNIPAEYVFAEAGGKECAVVGIMTTALQTAAKMGLQVTSYIESFNPDRKDVIELYKKIGIDVK